VIDAGDSGVVNLNSIIFEGDDFRNSDAVEIISAKSVGFAKCDILNLDKAGGTAVTVFTPKSCNITVTNCTFDQGSCAIIGDDFSNFFITNSRFFNYSYGAVMPGEGPPLWIPVSSRTISDRRPGGGRNHNPQKLSGRGQRENCWRSRVGNHRQTFRKGFHFWRQVLQPRRWSFL